MASKMIIFNKIIVYKNNFKQIRVYKWHFKTDFDKYWNIIIIKALYTMQINLAQGCNSGVSNKDYLYYIWNGLSSTYVWKDNLS